MSIKESLEQVRSKLTEEQVADLGSVLKSIENEGNSLMSDLSAANAESKQRKLKIRELEEKMGDWDVEKAMWEKKKAEYEEKINDPTLKAKLEEIETKWKKFFGQQRNDFISKYDKISQNEKWDIAKDRFILPEEKDGKLDWENISDTDMEKNIAKLNELNELKYFGDDIKPAPSVQKGGNVGPIPTMEKVLEIRDKYGVLSEEYKEANKKYQESKT